MKIFVLFWTLVAGGGPILERKLSKPQEGVGRDDRAVSGRGWLPGTPKLIDGWKKAEEFSSTSANTFASLASSYKAKEYLLAEVMENPLFLLNWLPINIDD